MKIIPYACVTACLTLTLVKAAPSQRCACASIDTSLYTISGQSATKIGSLSAPSCLSYHGNQVGLNVGNIYAEVTFHGHAAHVLTSDVYITDCHHPFTCVCASGAAQIHAAHSTSSPAVTSLTSDDCVTWQQHRYTSGTTTWLQVTSGGKTGWIEKSKISFNTHCHANKSRDTSVQLPGCPQIVTRADWGARAPKSISMLTRTPYYAFVHHGATRGCHTKSECIRLVQSYQNYHMDSHGWSDIGYSFVVGEDGHVYEGRGWDRVGAHTYHYNQIGLGFCVIGNFMEHPPNAAAQDVLRKLIACGVSNSKLTSTYTLLGHRDVGGASGPTVCPGDKFYSIIQTWPHYNATVIPS